jgi:hypothetical protein
LIFVSPVTLAEWGLPFRGGGRASVFYGVVEIRRAERSDAPKA